MIKKNEITGIILCGGKSSRMGVNKALLEYQGVRLIESILKLHHELFDEVILVTKTPLDYAYLDAEIVSDIIPGRGAISGIYTGLFYASHEHSFICACDMPFLDKEFIEYMLQRLDSYDIVVPRSRDGRQPLHALYSKKCLRNIEEQIKNNLFKIDYLYNSTKLLEIEPKDIDAHIHCDRERIFFNVNTNKDWKEISEKF